MNITNIDDIRKLASGDEGGRTEYKLITGQLERGMETLCAFLNGEGGTVLFGVADNGKITGQEVSDKTPIRAVCHDNGLIRKHSRHGQTGHCLIC